MNEFFQSFIVSVPYEITLLSNAIFRTCDINEFQYLMKLHYSQTAIVVTSEEIQFQYLMKLHYSQTPHTKIPTETSFSTL